MELFTTKIEPGKELHLVNYIDEMDIVIKPVLKILYQIEDDSFNMENQDLKSLLFTAIWNWEHIDQVFMQHNRKVNGIPEKPEPENHTIGA